MDSAERIKNEELRMKNEKTHALQGQFNSA
jgi:hypothetical protein